MSSLMLAASDVPRSTSAVSLPLPQPPEFRTEAECFAWIAAEYRRRVNRPGANRIQLARDIAAIALEISLQELRGASRVAHIARKRRTIICLIRILTGASHARIGLLVNRHRIPVLLTCHKYEGTVAKLLKSDGPR